MQQDNYYNKSVSQQKGKEKVEAIWGRLWEN